MHKWFCRYVQGGGTTWRRRMINWVAFKNKIDAILVWNVTLFLGRGAYYSVGIIV